MAHGIIKKYILVNYWGVSCPVFIYDGNHEGDEFWPEVQVLYGWALLLTGNVLFTTLHRKRFRWLESEGSLQGVLNLGK